MAWICAHTGDVHIDEDHYFGDTAQCLEWFVADAIRSNVDLFVINGDLTTYKATIKERNLWIDILIRMAGHAPVVLTAGNHGAELDGDLYVYAKARGRFPVSLCTEPEFIELDRAAIAVFPYPRKAEHLGMPNEVAIQEGFVEQLEEFNQRFARRPDCFRLFFGHFGVTGARVSSGQPLGSGWQDCAVAFTEAKRKGAVRPAPRCTKLYSCDVSLASKLYNSIGCGGLQPSELFSPAFPLPDGSPSGLND